MSTLTDRYVWAVVRSLPEKQRADIDRELRASIADSIDDRIEAGTDEAAAERDVLLELGDPDRLAAGYADRPAFLIGPKFYFDYVRLLKVLYGIVLPIVFAAVVVGHVIAGDGIGEVIGGSVATAIATAAHLGFWTTLVFAILERSAQPTPLTVWKLDALPELPDRRAGTGLVDLILPIVFLLFFAGALVWQQFYSVFTDESGQSIPVLQPDLWSFWLPLALVIVAAEIVFCVVLYRLRRWTWPMAIVNVLLNLVFVVPAVWLTLGDRLVNPDFLARLNWPDGGIPVLVPIMVLVFVGVAVGDAIDGIVKAAKASLTPA